MNFEYKSTCFYLADLQLPTSNNSSQVSSWEQTEHDETPSIPFLHRYDKAHLVSWLEMLPTASSASHQTQISSWKREACDKDIPHSGAFPASCQGCGAHTEELGGVGIGSFFIISQSFINNLPNCSIKALQLFILGGYT